MPQSPKQDSGGKSPVKSPKANTTDDHAINADVEDLQSTDPSKKVSRFKID
jgi:hypothetical protein